MSIVKHTHADFMQASRTMIDNAIASPELAAEPKLADKLSRFGYTAAK